jgi:hypothetical protein
MPKAGLNIERLASSALALSLLLCACTPKTPEQKAQEAARAAVAAVANDTTSPYGDALLSPADLAQAQAGTLRGYREDAARLSIHYMLEGPGKGPGQANTPEPRRWIALAAATGSSQAIQNYVDLLRFSDAPADCAEAGVQIAKAKTLYAGEIAAAKAKNLRDAKIEALERLRDQERQIADGGCGR